jgi:hypothetical protein
MIVRHTYKIYISIYYERVLHMAPHPFFCFMKVQVGM